MNRHVAMSSLTPLSSGDGSLDVRRWDAFVAGRRDGHLLQTSRWGQLKASFGWQAEQLALASQGDIVAGAQLLIRRLPWGQSLAYVPKGPLVGWRQAELVGPLLEELRAAARRRRAALLKLEPDLVDSPLLDLLIESYGLSRGQAAQPRSTIHVDLGQGLDAALAGMKQKWRYNVRLAGRRGVVIRPGSASDLPDVHRLIVETGQRDDFGVHESAYYQRAYELFAGDGTAQWLLAEVGDKLLGAVVVFALGSKSWYMWGASSGEERQRMPNHALQWAAMQWAHARHCQHYDLWGIPDEVGAEPEAWDDGHAERQDGLWGVYRFKQGFGGRIVRYTGAWDLPISSAGYRLYQAARRWRR